MKNMIKRCVAGLSAFGVSAFAMAQEASGTDAAFTTFITDIKDSILDKITEMLPILGMIAGGAFIIFIAVFAVRKAKTFLNRGA